MLDSDSFLPMGLSMRPALMGDKPFLEILYKDVRPDLNLIDDDQELVKDVVTQQYQLLQEGAGSQHPNALYYVIEKDGESIGGLIVDFGPNEIRVVCLAFIKAAQGKGYSKCVLQALQLVGKKVGAPLSLVVQNSNLNALRQYQGLSFEPVEQGATHTLLMWYPGQDQPSRGFDALR